MRGKKGKYIEKELGVMDLYKDGIGPSAEYQIFRKKITDSKAI